MHNIKKKKKKYINKVNDKFETIIRFNKIFHYKYFLLQKEYISIV